MIVKIKPWNIIVGALYCAHYWHPHAGTKTPYELARVQLECTWHVLVDKVIAEFFVQGGRAVDTSGLLSGVAELMDNEVWLEDGSFGFEIRARTAGVIVSVSVLIFCV